MDAVILAGGRGKRLGDLTKNLPKPLIKIGSRSLIEHQILLLKKYKIENVWILAGYFGSEIERCLGNGRNLGVKIKYIFEDQPLGTGGALKTLEGIISSDFLLLSGDILVNFDVSKLIKFHRHNPSSIATLVVHPNDHPHDSDLVEVNEQGKILFFYLRPHPKTKYFHNLSIASFYVISPKIFRYIYQNEQCDLEKVVLLRVFKSKRAVFGYRSFGYFKDIGIPSRLKSARGDYNRGKFANFGELKRRPAAFIDRDGVINEEVDQLSKVDNLKVYHFSAEALKRLAAMGYLTVLITNQPMIAKGMMSFGALDTIHKKLETELGLKGAWIDRIYFCPHHPESGFENEVKSLKINCNCRKPKTGLIKKATVEMNINLGKSIFIGDSTVDARTAFNARIKFVGVKTGYGMKDNKYIVPRKFEVFENLLDVVKSLKFS